MLTVRTFWLFYNVGVLLVCVCVCRLSTALQNWVDIEAPDVWKSSHMAAAKCNAPHIHRLEVWNPNLGPYRLLAGLGGVGNVGPWVHLGFRIQGPC